MEFDSVGLGVEEILFALDNDSFGVYSGMLSLGSEGEREINFFATDVVGKRGSGQDRDPSLLITPLRKARFKLWAASSMSRPETNT